MRKFTALLALSLAGISGIPGTTISAQNRQDALLENEAHYATIDGPGGEFNYRAGSNWRNSYTTNIFSSTYVPQFTITTPQNDMSAAATAGTFIIASGTDFSSDWHFSITGDFVITGYSFDYTSKGNVPVVFTLPDQSTVQGVSGSIAYAYNGQTPDAVFVLADLDANKVTGVGNKEVWLTNFKIYYETTKTKEELLEAAKKYVVLAGKGIGYPASNSAVHTALQAAIAAEEADDTECNRTGLNNALFAFLSSTDVEMPEDGKAYTLTFRPVDLETGEYRYLDFTGTGLTALKRETLETALPPTATFVCRKWNDGGTDKYLFVPGYVPTGATNAYGKYMANNTVSNSYSAGINDCLIIPMSTWATQASPIVTNTTLPSVADRSAENMFGYVFLEFQKRSTGTNDKGILCIPDGGSALDNTHSPFLGSNGKGNFTSAIIMEEVSYPNLSVLNAASGIDEIDGIATFSAPYPALIPDGVKAYYVQSATTDYASLTELTGAIPAGTGVLLTGTASSTPLLMLPAKGEAAGSADGNLLKHSAGDPAKVLSAETDYILTKIDGTVAFYGLRTSGTETQRTLATNKSYLDLAGIAGTTSYAIRMKFGGSQATGIANATSAADDANAPVYDLSGRHVSDVQKGGIYIRNGKKLILK